jgi:hypothetical protein
MTNYKTRFQQLLFIYYSILAAIVIFFFIGLYLVEYQNAGNKDYNIPAIYITPPLTLILAIMAKVLYDRNRNKFLSAQPQFEEKLASFRTGNIVKIGMLEAAAFLNIITFIITANYFYLILLAAVTTIILINVPTRTRFAYDFKLTPEEIDKNI